MRRVGENQYLAALEQRDVARFCLKYQDSVTLTIPETGSNLYGATTILNMFKVLCMSPQYDAFSAMFDQVRVNGVRVTLVPISINAPASTTGRIQFAYAWDRNGVIYDSNTNPDHLLFREVASYGSCKQGVITPNSKSMIVTSLYAQTIQEKGQYLPTAAIKSFVNGSDPNDEEIRGPAFFPQFLLGIQTPVPSVSGQTPFGVKYACQVAFDLTFRGVRFDSAQ